MSIETVGYESDAIASSLFPVSSQGSLRISDYREETSTKEVIDQFIVLREERKLKLVLQVGVLGIGMAAVCLAGAVVDYCMQIYSNFHVNYIAANTIFMLLFLGYVCGLVTLSLCLNDTFDADKLIEDSTMMYRLLGSTLGIILAIFSVPAALFPPYFGVLITLSAVLMCFKPFGYFWFDHFSYKLSAYMMGWIIVFDWAFLWSAMSNTNTNVYRTLNKLQPLIPLPSHPDGEPVYPTFYLISFILTCLIVYTCRYCYVQHKLWFDSNKTMGSSPTQIASFCLYSFLGGIGIELLILGAMLMYYSDHQPDGDYDNGFYPGYNICIVGVEFLVPPILVLLLTPKRVFNYMASRFDSNVEVLEEDGAFIAELLDSVAVTLNQVCYTDYHRYWYKGIITSLDATTMSVKLIDTNVPVDISIKDSRIPSKQLLDEAKHNLRCVDFKDLTLDLFLQSVRDTTSRSYYSYSRAVSPGERIDYFISHSWSDDGELKYKKLVELAQWHRSRYGQDPTFWFDKVCIDQNNIGNGLKVLPINVMSCKYMLILAGRTYSDRLWCIWEIFTLLSFTCTDQAIKRLKLFPLQAEDGNVMEKLKYFHVDNAHCYDPNEELKLRCVISANGVDKFNNRVRELAKEAVSTLNTASSSKSLISVV